MLYFAKLPMRWHHEKLEDSILPKEPSHRSSSVGTVVDDYMKAVSEYRKSFPSKQDVIEQAPDPAVREMLLRLQEMGCETTFDRFDQQQPQ